MKATGRPNTQEKASDMMDGSEKVVLVEFHLDFCQAFTKPILGPEDCLIGKLLWLEIRLQRSKSKSGNSRYPA